MAFSLFERSVEREGGAVAEGNRQRGCGDVPRLLMCEILYYYKTCAQSEGNNGFTRKVPTYWLQTAFQGRVSSGGDVARTKTVNGPYVPSRVVREGALMSSLLPCLLSGVKGQFTRIGRSGALMSLLAHAAPKKKEVEITVQNNIALPLTSWTAVNVALCFLSILFIWCWWCGK